MLTTECANKTPNITVCCVFARVLLCLTSLVRPNQGASRLGSIHLLVSYPCQPLWYSVSVHAHPLA